MIYGSVCSGIEAATVAWHPLGWEPAFFSEIDAFPRAVLSHHYPEVPLHGDFTTIQAGDYRPIDLLVGGTPCQSFSIAGLRKGLEDERGNLALEFLRLADRLCPNWIVWENVPGVLSSNGGRDFGSIVGGLEEIGYGWAYRCLDARFFGVPQRRNRVLLVGYLGDFRRAATVLFEPESHNWDKQENIQGPAHPCLQTSCSDYSRADGFVCIENGDGWRRLMPVEAERLQGFLDSYTGLPGASDKARFKALGNSMAVPVMRWIGQRIQKLESLNDSY